MAAQKRKNENQVVIYQAASGALELRKDIEKQTIWATQAQIANLFDIERSVATKHVRNIFKDKELDEDSVCANFAHTESLSNSLSFNMLFICFVTTDLSTLNSCAICACVVHRVSFLVSVRSSTLPPLLV